VCCTLQNPEDFEENGGWSFLDAEGSSDEEEGDDISEGDEAFEPESSGGFSDACNIAFAKGVFAVYNLRYSTSGHKLSASGSHPACCCLQGCALRIAYSVFLPHLC
jgi:hypothetical protein